MVDFDYLEGFAAGDRQVVLEVLAVFQQQVQVWARALDAGEPGWREMVHTIKGAARGVGANALGEACATAEVRGESGLPAVRQALAAAAADIAAYLASRRG